MQSFCFKSVKSLSFFKIQNFDNWLTFDVLQCFDTVGWVTGKASGL